MQRFYLFWLDGKQEVVEGHSIEDAFTRAGYGQGAVSALDFFSKSKFSVDEYSYNPETHNWERQHVPA